MYVARATNHPAEDLERNWSAPTSGFFISELTCNYPKSQEEFDEIWAKFDCYNDNTNYKPKVRYHPAFEHFVEVHYEGLGAWSLEAETLEEAIKEASKKDAVFMVCTDGKGNAHFFAEEVVSYWEATPGIWVFELNY